MGVLKYLKKGGRIKPAAATIGDMLKLKPVLSSNGDTWTKVEDSCTLYSEFNGILIAKQFKYSMDGINWKSIKPADTTQTLAEYYYFGCNTILACSSPLGVYYSKTYFS